MKTESPPWGCSLVWLKAVACRAKDRGFKSHLPRLVASWTNREVAVPLKHGEAGATPVDAPNEDVAQMERAPVSEAGSHRFDPCHPRSWEWIGITCSETNKRTVAGLGYPPGRQSLQFPTFPPNLQVAKWEGVGLQNRLLVGNACGNASRTIPTLESKLLQRSLTAKPQAHNLVITGSTPVAATNAQMV